ncbi:toll/interleukin-1 receptor domain-containing protein [Bacillus cereus]|uniref:TIR domain-containing protein n=1 Tax=Bacillus cereus TaxID=1396 RepID=A0A2A7I322_BACCE|nr:toll/interleukin-1 receptor domain-containing protein [Bacillus cereus]PEC23494.1 hypothetical protein COM96_03610 [Bacillus cereus]
MEKNLYLYQAAEKALQEIGTPARLAHILDVIKQNQLYEFGTKDPRIQLDSLAKSMENSSSISKIKPGTYELSAMCMFPKHTIVPSITEKRSLNMNKKIFISHSTVDQEYVAEVVSLLLQMGVASDRIKCSSFYPYGVEAGQDIFDWMQEELTDNAIVICMLSENYYKSLACATELGAAWVLSKIYVPILIPPTSFQDIKGIPQSKKAFKINDKYEFNYVKDAIVKHLELPFDERIWERLKDEFMGRVTLKLATHQS